MENEHVIRDIKKVFEEQHKKGDILLQNIKDNLPELEELLDKSTRCSEDDIYRFYHHSFKVYGIQDQTEQIVEVLRKISPHEKNERKEFDEYFETIYLEGTTRNKEWEMDHNQIWCTVTRPFLEAFFHAKYFLEMAIKYGKELEEAPSLLPSGWAALLELYNIR